MCASIVNTDGILYFCITIISAVMTRKIYLSLGSNSGDREAMLESAISRIGAFGELEVSPVFRSEPVGFESRNSFFNICAVLTVECGDDFGTEDAEALLRRFKAIECGLSAMPHRNADGSYRDREIDIDIVAVEGLRMCTPVLTLPHPRAVERAFVVQPLKELGVDTDALFKRSDEAH